MNKSIFFDKVATGNDPLLFTPEHHRQIEQLKERLGDLTGCHVLEPGCGAGPLTGYLSQWVGPEGAVLAFDNSPGMLELCRKEHGHRPNVTIWCAAAESADLPPASCDLIMLFRVFPHFDDKEHVLRHVRPVLKKEGRLVIAHLEGRVRLNEYHSRLDLPIRHDHMPCLQGVTRMLHEHQYEVVTGIDTDEEFFVEAVVKKYA